MMTPPPRVHRGSGWLSLGIGLLLGLALATPSWALPTEGQVVGGAATIKQPNAQTLHVEQLSDRALLNWQGFSIGANETVRFLQPNAGSLAVNRVLGGDPSVILGSLLANGRVFLLNPNGILFGAGSVVNVAGFLATTLSLQDHDLQAGRFTFRQDPSKALASIINKGTITVSDHGFVVLTAPGVVNEGLIVAKFGQVGLGAGTQMTVDFRGDGLIQYAVDGKVLSQVMDPSGRPLASAISNTGRIEADGGTVLLTAQASSAVVSSVINQAGVIQARRLEQVGGEIVLRGGDDGAVMVAGTLDASGPGLGQTGGTIQVRGEKIGLTETARLDASGDAGGGIITVGGAFKGQGSGDNAAATVVKAGAVLSADAVTQGDGGQIVAWADGFTRYAGHASARGGALGGDGGLIEVSGKETLNFLGSVDLRAPQGQVGTLLLDPKFIIIQAGGPDPATGQTFANNQSGTATISGANLGTALNSANVTLQANTDATFDDNVTATTAGNGLTVQAGRSIIFNANRVLTLNNGTFDATTNFSLSGTPFAADRDAGTAQFVMNGGSQILTNGGVVSITMGVFGFVLIGEVRIGNGTGAATIDGGNVLITGSGRSGSTSAYGIDIRGGSLIQGAGGGISLNGTGGNGTADNVGVLIRDPGTQITSPFISIVGTGGLGTGSSSEGIRLVNGVTIGAAATNSILLRGTGADTSAGIRTQGPGLNSIGGPLALGNLAFEARTGTGSDSIQLASLSVQSTGVLALRPITNGDSVGINGGPGVYNLDATELGFFMPGFSFINIGRGTGTAAVTVNGLTRSEQVNVLSEGAGGSIIVNNPITLTGSGSLLFLAAGQRILLNSGANLTTNTGGITLRGNLGGLSTGNFTGVEINNATVNANGASIEISGKGGTTGNDNVGVLLRNGAVVMISNGVITGSGGPGADFNDGIRVQDAGTKVTASSFLSMTGTGGAGSGQDNIGLSVKNGAVIEYTGTGSVGLQGIGGNGPGGTGLNIGDPGTKVSATGGDLLIIGGGNGTAGLPGPNAGIMIHDGGIVQGTGLANITLQGQGGVGVGSSSSTGQAGVFVDGTGTQVTTSGGSLIIGGTGGGTGIANYGVLIHQGALVESTGSKVRLTGGGSLTGTNDNHGIVVADPGTLVRGATGVELNGQGGGDGTGTGNVGIIIDNSAKVQSTVLAANTPGVITLTGTGGSGTSDNAGVQIVNGGLVTAVDAGVSIMGTGGDGNGAGNRGVVILSGAQVVSSGTATIAITGSGGGGSSTDFNQGVAMGQSGSRVASAGGDITMTGNGGGSEVGISNQGVLITNGAQVEGTGNAAVTITGTGGLGTAINSFSGPTGIYLGIVPGSGLPFVVRTANGDLTLDGTSLGSYGGQGTFIRGGAGVEATGSGNVLIMGTGSATGTSYNHGVVITEAGSTVRANTGNITIGSPPGPGGSGAVAGGTENNNIGVGISSGALIEKTGPGGTITITGTGGGGGGGANNFGVVLYGDTTQILANGGAISIYGFGNGGVSGVLATNGFLLPPSTANINAGGGGTVVINSVP